MQQPMRVEVVVSGHDTDSICSLFSKKVAVLPVPCSVVGGETLQHQVLPESFCYFFILELGFSSSGG